MRRVKMLMLLLLGGAIVSASPASLAAQEAEDVDVDAVAERVATVDGSELAEALETPLAADALPEGFIAAEYVDPAATPEADVALAERGIIPTEELEGVETSVTYTVEGDPEILGGIVSINALSYIILESTDVADDSLGTIGEGIEQSLAEDEAGAEVTVEETELAGTDALLVTYAIADEAATAAARLYIVPVGTVLVVGLVTIADQGPVDSEAVGPPAEELTLAGITHLDAVSSDIE